MTYRGRFAPSPTGRLHFGSLISAVACHAQARAEGGRWLVRIEDVDRAREVQGAADAILEDLRAHGMTSDEPVVRQRDRDAAYEAVIAELLARGVAFHCACTRSDLPPDGVYPGTCVNGLPAGCEPRSIRVSVPDDVIGFDDRIQGRCEQQLAAEVGAFVIRRADGYYAYQLAVVVDDAWQGITEVVRGCDLLDSTARQIHLQRLLGYPTPRYAHHPVIVTDDGRKLSKALASTPIRADDPMPALLAAWAFLGQPPPPPAARRQPLAFWEWAPGAWRLDDVPRRQTIGLA